MNVSEGFLPSFAPAFVERFGGPESEFVRALSDVFTRAIALLMKNAGQLHQPDAVRFFSDAAAADVVQELVVSVPDRNVFLSEATGSAAPGVIENAIDTRYGARTFRAWLDAFEARDHLACLDLLRDPDQDPASADT